MTFINKHITATQTHNFVRHLHPSLFVITADRVEGPPARGGGGGRTARLRFDAGEEKIKVPKGQK
jgi:hypothetical protein